MGLYFSGDRLMEVNLFIHIDSPNYTHVTHSFAYINLILGTYLL